MALNHIVQGSASYSTSGSPTIVDGVVSGFSDRNVLVISPTFTPTYSSFEIVLKIKTGADVTTEQKIFTSQYGANNENRFGFVIGISGGKITHQSTVDGTSWANESTGTTTLLANTDYYIKCVRNASTITYFLSTNNETWMQEISTSFSSPNVNFIITYIGNFYSYVVGEDYAFAGSLDLKGTYIKTNSSAWFGKCPVEVKHINRNSSAVNYVIKDGKLVFADTNIYLESDGNQYIQTEYTPVQGDEAKVAFFTSQQIVGLQAVFSAGTGTYQYIMGPYFATYETQTYTKYFRSGTAPAFQVFPYNLWANFSQYNGVSKLEVSGNTYEVADEYQAPLDGNATTLWLFKRRNGQRPFYGKIKAFSITNNSVLKMHLVPVPAGLQIGSFTVPSNGMFDMVNQQFYANAGTGTFTIGRDE